MNVLVTGGAGFLGSHIAKYHLDAGDNVTILDNLSSGSIDNLSSIINHKNLEFIEEDLSRLSDLKIFTKNLDLVYHFAALVGVFNVCEKPIQTLHENVVGFYNLFEALKKNNIKPRVLFASTSEVYGKNCNGLDEESQLFMPDPKYMTISYAISKIAGENLGFCYYNLHKIPFTAVRIFNVIGPNQTGKYGMVVPRFIKQAVNNEDITIFGDGSQQRCFCDVRDFIQMLIRITETKESIGQVYNIGTQNEISILELAKLIKTLLKSSSGFKFIPYKEAYAIDFIDTIRRKPNTQKLYDLIHYECKYSLEQSILNIADTL